MEVRAKGSNNPSPPSLSAYRQSPFFFDQRLFGDSTRAAQIEGVAGNCLDIERTVARLGEQIGDPPLNAPWSPTHGDNTDPRFERFENDFPSGGEIVFCPRHALRRMDLPLTVNPSTNVRGVSVEQSSLPHRLARLLGWRCGASFLPSCLPGGTGGAITLNGRRDCAISRRPSHRHHGPARARIDPLRRRPSWRRHRARSPAPERWLAGVHASEKPQAQAGDG
jgi:hypothetical protein